ncbi:hypothetical protein LINPERHAP1_LOCUS4610 [Linum perenne]
MTPLFLGRQKRGKQKPYRELLKGIVSYPSKQSTGINRRYFSLVILH